MYVRPHLQCLLPDHFCIPLRCGLCRFDLVRDVDVTPDGRFVTFPFPPWNFVDDDSIYEPCYPGCLHDGQRLMGCHVDCIQRGISYSLPIPELFNATAYAYSPSPGEDLRRLRWMRRRLITIIHIFLSKSLSYEVCDIIARYLLLEYALQIISEFCQSAASDFFVDLSKPVWACYASLDGLAYIISLTNNPTLDNTKPILQPDAPIKTIYVAEDHLGVREVHFAIPTPDCHRPGLWWRTVRVHRTTLFGETDGFKLRRVYDTRAGRAISTFGSDVLWATPRVFTKRLRFSNIRIQTMLKKSAEPLRMTPFRLEEGNWDLLALKAHTSREDLSYYKYVAVNNPKALWVYIPIRLHERITEIWRCFSIYRSGKYSDNAALILVTNIGRTYFIGQYPKPEKSLEYKLLYKRLLDNDLLFVDNGPVGIYTVASGVENVAYFRLCRAKPGSIITGLIFEYTDGHRESKLWLRISLSYDGFPHVVDTGFSLVSGPREEYLYITWHGVLEWWFSFNQCRLYHDGQASLSDRPLLLSCGPVILEP
ncbi:hypothetical protein F5Y19DRAFT_489415 [Xylariaceae sp. FL1651]|nr:hypothetical protein F5Y19DRAFT_489415 [Xylariaceae sp. FL1651]